MLRESSTAMYDTMTCIIKNILAMLLMLLCYYVYADEEDNIISFLNELYIYFRLNVRKAQYPS